MVTPRAAGRRTRASEERNRRSVYIFVQAEHALPDVRGVRYAGHARNLPRRNQTITAPQALALLNNELVLDWAQAFAGRVLNDGGLTPEAQVERAYRARLFAAAGRMGEGYCADFLATAERCCWRAQGATRRLAAADDRCRQELRSGAGGGVCRSLPYAAELERIRVSELEVHR